MKKLNSKGFTLVELLAVVVILAVVMGIATTSVITAMNNSRKGSLEDSAVSVENAFKTKYSEAMVSGTVSKIYADEMGLTEGYNFNKGSSDKVVFYYLNEKLRDELNLSPDSYSLDYNSTIEEIQLNTDGKVYISGSGSDAVYDGLSKSFIAFNGSSIVVCLVANETGSYYVANFAKNNETKIFTETVKFKENSMWSCSSDDTNSWTSTNMMAR